MAEMNLMRSAPSLVALLAALAVSVVMAGCATKGQDPASSAPAAPSPAPPPAPSATPPAATAPAPAQSTDSTYRCENGVQFSLRVASDGAVIDMGARGSESLLRDAGGITPDQTVYTNARIRAEFGLGPQGRGAALRYIATPVVLRCTRD
ncbi:MAG: hypothetical protein V4684_01355 [Pseudomonadota bacterium]